VLRSLPWTRRGHNHDGDNAPDHGCDGHEQKRPPAQQRACYTDSNNQHQSDNAPNNATSVGSSRVSLGANLRKNHSITCQTNLA
jgi:hypothetical protein